MRTRWAMCSNRVSWSSKLSREANSFTCDNVGWLMAHLGKRPRPAYPRTMPLRIPRRRRRRLRRLDLEGPLPVQQLEQVALVRLVPAQLERFDRADVQPVDVLARHHLADEPLVPGDD